MRHRLPRRFALVLGGALVGTGPSGTAAAQDDVAPAVPPAVFLEKAYFSLKTPTGKDLLFEGQPSVHYFLYNGLANGDWQKNGGFRFAAPVSELFVVRMTDTTSEPVLTPSYRIRPIYLQAFYLHRPSPTSRRYWLFGLAGGATHYSNGQRGCTFRGFGRNTQGDCVVIDPALGQQRIANTDDGDFSTTYVSVAAHARRAHLPEPFSPVMCQLTIGVEYQNHPLNMRPGGINAEQASVWGREQISLMLEGEHRFGEPGGALTGVARIAGELLQRFGGGVPEPLRAQQVEASYVLDRVEHFGLFVRGHWGFDYYNIQFQDRRSFFSIGVIWDMGRFDRLNSGFTRGGSPPRDTRCRLF